MKYRIAFKTMYNENGETYDGGFDNLYTGNIYVEFDFLGEWEDLPEPNNAGNGGICKMIWEYEVMDDDDCDLFESYLDNCNAVAEYIRIEEQGMTASEFLEHAGFDVNEHNLYALSQYDAENNQNYAQFPTAWISNAMRESVEEPAEFQEYMREYEE